jgi:hypothetical protein
MFLKRFVFPVCCLAIVSCAHTTPEQLIAEKQVIVPREDSIKMGYRFPADTNYMRTGLYLLSDSLHGVKMNAVEFNEIYYISKLPFAREYNLTISKEKLTLVFEGPALKPIYDKDSAGNPRYSQIAFVVGGKLRFVIENNTMGYQTSVTVYVNDQITETLKAIDKNEMALNLSL